jgi:hypothetical protein
MPVGIATAGHVWRNVSILILNAAERTDSSPFLILPTLPLTFCGCPSAAVNNELVQHIQSYSSYRKYRALQFHTAFV